MDAKIPFVITIFAYGMDGLIKQLKFQIEPGIWKNYHQIVAFTPI